MRFNLSTNLKEELIEPLGEEWEAIQSRHDALDLWNAIVAAQNAVSAGNNGMDGIKTRRHIETLRRGPNETPLMFKDSLKKALNAIEQLGEATAGITDSVLFLASHFTDRFSKTVILTTWTQPDTRHFWWNLKIELPKERHAPDDTLGSAQPGTKVKDHTTQINGISNPLAVYVAQNDGGISESTIRM
jgi:hypothetical protein